MNRASIPKTFCRGLALGVVAILLLARCSSDEGRPGDPAGKDASAAADTGAGLFPDAGEVPDTGSSPPDAGARDAAQSDAGVRDASPADSGARDATSADAAPRDAAPDAALDSGIFDGAVRDGGPDAGFPCTPNEEGCECTPSSSSQRGSCANATNICVEWSRPGEPPIASCIRPCSTDLDCVPSRVGRACRVIRDAERACVTEEVAEGGTCQGSLRNDRPMTGCAAGQLCVHGPLGLEDDQGSCGKGCAPTPQNPGGGCVAPRPYCNPALTGLTALPGVCSARSLPLGAVCSQIDITRQCDTSTTADTACFAIPDSAPTEGVCVELCNSLFPQCVATSDPTLQAACVPISSVDLFLGVCSDDCSRFPDDCTGQGKGFGANCTEPLVVEQGLPSLSFCVDVQDPVIAEKNWVTPPSACAGSQGEPLRCADGTFCSPDGAGSSCVRGCTLNPFAPMTGCEAAQTMTPVMCSFAQLGTFEGICRP